MPQSRVRVLGGEPFGWFFRQRCWRRLLSLPEVRRGRVCFCRFGTPWRKRTDVVSTGCLGDLHLPCMCTEPHFLLRGRTSAGVAWTKVAEPYPPGVADVLAQLDVEEMLADERRERRLAHRPVYLQLLVP